MNQPTYESVFRRKEFAIVTLLLLVLGMFGAIALAVIFIEDGNDLLQVILGSIGLVLVGMIAVLLATFRIYRWTIEAAGLRIEERQKIPLTGFPRRAFVAFADIAALRNLESGFDGVIEIVTRDGNVYRLMRPSSVPVRAKEAETLPDLQAFAASLSQAIAAAGASPVPVTEGLSFWNRGAGLSAIAGFMVLSILLAGATLWALLGGGLPYRPRGGEAIAIFLALPFGVGYLLHRSLKRRRRVLSANRPLP
ncbi:MAG: hypothetical protein WD715_03640 [Dongiaceae bacterium]